MTLANNTGGLCSAAGEQSLPGAAVAPGLNPRPALLPW